MRMLNIFVSFHHDKNQRHAEKIRNLIKIWGFNDITPNNGTKVQDEEYKSSEAIRKEIRDKFLKDVDITIVVVGSDTINRKHIDWEIRSSVYKFKRHRMSAGIVVVNCLENNYYNYNWLPERLKSSIKNGAFVPIIKYNNINLQLLNAIWDAYNKRDFNKDKWDVQTKMRRKNNESNDRLQFSQVRP